MTRPAAFHLPNESMNSILRIHFTKEMHMIGHTCTACKCRCDLQFQNCCRMFRSYFTEEGFQPCGYLVDQHFPSVLRTPNNMIFARIYNIAVTSIYTGLFDRTHVLHYTTLRWIVNQFRRFAPPRYIPTAVARGFTAGFGKGVEIHDRLGTDRKGKAADRSMDRQVPGHG